MHYQPYIRAALWLDASLQVLAFAGPVVAQEGGDTVQLTPPHKVVL